MQIKPLLLNIFPRPVTFDAFFTQIWALVPRALKGTDARHFPDTDGESALLEASLPGEEKMICTLPQSTVIFTKNCNGNSRINT